MRHTFALLALTSCCALSEAAYTLQNIYNTSNWYSSFIAEQIADPTNGYVNYLSQSDAQAKGLYKIIGNQIYMAVDNTSILDPNGVGRNSVRIASNAAFNKGLYIFDMAHLPGTACGSWPAVWLLGSGTWPNNGEIDIVEGINNQTRNQVTIHSRTGCNVKPDPQYGEYGTWGSATPCDAGNNNGYNGCTVFGQGNSFGTGFNAAGGGVYAMHWTSSAIKVWLFTKAGGIPTDISNGGTPNPGSWGTPVASFTGCTFDSYFANMQILFDTTFCGSWAGAQWSNSAACSPKASTCQNFVAANPHAYDESYFLINSIRVYSG